MWPIGPLMREHRLIERLVALMKAELERIKSTGRADPDFLLTAADFFRSYADRCHHGKEEDILFRDLAQKSLQEEHRLIMAELVEDHRGGRRLVKELRAARDGYVRGDPAALGHIRAAMEKLVEFYPRHILKEDKGFFFPCMDYFSDEEKARMLAEFAEFDQKMIHEKYERTVETWEAGG